MTIQPLSGHTLMHCLMLAIALIAGLSLQTRCPHLYALRGFLKALLLLRQKKTISKVTEINFSNEVAWHTVKG